jgi:hypothetical protein
LFKAERAIAMVCAVALALACALGAAPTKAAAAGPVLSGSLIAGGVLSGEVSVSVTLSTPVGASSMAVTIDGVQVADAYGTELWVDTGALADGSHLVAVTMTDSSGEDALWTGLVQTANAPQGGVATILGEAQQGQTLVAQSSGWSPQPTALAYQWQRCDAGGGSCGPIAGATAAAYTAAPADDYAQLEVVVTASDTGGSTSTTSSGSGVVLDAGESATPVLAAPLGSSAPRVSAGAPAAGSPGASPSVTGSEHGASGAGACRGARLRASFAGSRRLATSFGQRAILRGSLRCGSAPLKHAILSVLIKPAAGGARTQRVSVRTRADGSFAYAVAPGPSRRIEVSYRATAQSASASVTASVVVTPQISLAITPTHTTNDHTITFRGRVSGGDEPHGGLPLELEYREGAQWMIYQVVHADPRDGSFVYRYTFRRTTQSITYTFRFAIPSSGVDGYPYQPAVSPPRSVRVDA